MGGVTTEDQYDYSGDDNRLLGINRNGAAFRTFTYDDAGNITTEVQGGVTTAYAYNDADRMASFTRGGTLRGEYSYNARGQLVIRTVTNSSNNGTTVYVYDQEGHVIAEYDGVTGTVKREYIWLGDRPVAIVDPGSPSDDIYYVHADHLNRPIAMTDAGKNLVAEFTWRPFGELGYYTGTVGLDLRFPGQMLQAESGLYYNWFRQYDPTTGRYTQPDPIGLVDGPGRYTYVMNDPLQRIDPTGQQLRIPLPVPVPPMSLPNPNIDLGGLFRGIGATLVLCATHNPELALDIMYNRPRGFWPADKGAEEWGRRHGVPPREAKDQFHDIKQGHLGSGADEDYSVNPETGEIRDSNGDYVDTLG